MKEFQKFMIKKYISTDYVGSSRESYNEIKVMKLNLDATSVILASEGLYGWLYPDLPENLCLFSKGKCWVKSIAHEKLCFIYTDS